MTAASMSRCSSPSRWSATSSGSSPPPARSAAMSETTGGAGVKSGAASRDGEETMEARAMARYVRVTPRKARRVVDMIRGMPAEEAQAVLSFAPQAASAPVRKVLASAIANADARGGRGDRGMLWVRRAWVDEGPTLKRFRPRAQGRGYRVLKRTSHITVIVSDDSEGGTR